MCIRDRHFPDGEKSALKAFAGLFLDLQIKAYHGEISTKSLDLRGLVSAVKATRGGLSPIDAIQMGIIKDVYKRQLREHRAAQHFDSHGTARKCNGGRRCNKITDKTGKIFRNRHIGAPVSYTHLVERYPDRICQIKTYADLMQVQKEGKIPLPLKSGFALL